MKKIALLLSLILLISACGCGQKHIESDGNSQAEASSTLKIGVSIAPQKAFAEAICGDKAEVLTLIPAGASAESYEPTIKEVEALNSCNLYFTVGIPAEQGKTVAQISKEVKKIDLAAKVSRMYKDLTINGERDPHIWLSVKRAIVMVREMAEQICYADPENSELYKENSKKYILELENTQSKIEDILSTKGTSVFYISHPSYGYFASDFGLHMTALEKDGRQITPKELSKIVAEAKENKTKAVFCQKESSKAAAELLAKEIGGRVEILEPFAMNYTENLIKTAKLISGAID